MRKRFAIEFVGDTNFDGIIDSETVDTNIDVGITDFLSDLFG